MEQTLKSGVSKRPDGALQNTERPQDNIIGALINGGGELIDKIGIKRLASINWLSMHRGIFDAIGTLYDSGVPITLELVLNELEKNRQLLDRIGGPRRVGAMTINGNPDPKIVEHFIGELQTTAAEQSLISFAAQLQNYSITPGNFRESSKKIVDLCKPDRSGLSIRSWQDIAQLKLPENDNLLGDRLLCKSGKLVIAGPPGIGKSRFTTQLSAAFAAGVSCCGIETHAKGQRILILQNENGNHRLQRDVRALGKEYGADLPITIHTLENDDDGFVSLDDPNAIAGIERLIEKAKPDIVVVDPFRDFIIGDPNSDGDMRRTLQELRRIITHGNPARATIIVHHSLTGKAGILKASGYERGGFARNSKVLLGFARAQINITPGSASNNEVLVITCGKNNDGREFERFAVELDVTAMIYKVADDFDFAKWDAEVGNRKPDAVSHHPELVQELLRGQPLTGPELVKRIRAAHRLEGDSVPYELVKKAKDAGLIKKDGKQYVAL